MANKEYRDSFAASHNSGMIAAQISAMRHERGWTQGDMALRCGMKQPRISALEDPDFDNVELKTLQRIAAACDVAIYVSFVPFSFIAKRSTEMGNSDFNVKDYSSDRLSDARANSISYAEMSIKTDIFTNLANVDQYRNYDKVGRVSNQDAMLNVCLLATSGTTYAGAKSNQNRGAADV